MTFPYVDSFKIINSQIAFLAYLSICLFLPKVSFSQSNDFYDQSVIQEVKIYFDYSNWDLRLDSAKAGKEDYILAKSCLINGVKFDSVGVKYKGNSSYRSNQVKNPLHLKLNWVNDLQDYKGFTSVKLGNNFADPSAVREVLSYDILSNYMDCSRANFARVYINDVYLGLYSNVEAVNKNFCKDHFNSSNHVFVKGNPDKPGNNSTSNLVFNTYDSTKYYIYYGMENDYGWYKLIALMDSLRINVNALPKILDIDRSIWMHAFNSTFSNYDSYTGAFSQNYYLYEDDYGRFLPVIWDLNMSIGAFPGIGGTGGTQDKITFFNGEATANRPLIQQILKNPTYKKMYSAHVRTFCNEFVGNKAYETLAKNLQLKVDSLVKTDPNSLTTYANFLTSLTAPITSGGGPGGAAPGISTLMNARLAYFKTVTEFNAIPPLITNIIAFNKNINLGDSVWVNANITNLNTAFLAFRKNKFSLFEKQTMYDDGKHHDQKAGDGIFGAAIIPTTNKTQYYIYAENSAAGIFSPERAEYEYHIMEIQEPFADLKRGEIVINEIMSNNSSTVIDSTDQNYEDWVELYNNTNQDLDLGGIQLSDDFTDPSKWIFPQGSKIKAKDRMVIWLDEDNANYGILHANFKLSSLGEELILSRPDGIVMDSLQFGLIPVNQSLERCPDGLGDFKLTLKPSFNLANCGGITGSSDLVEAQIMVYPNPVQEELNIISERMAITRLELRDIRSNLVANSNYANINNLRMNVQSLVPGIYYLKIFTKDDSIFFKKIIVQ